MKHNPMTNPDTLQRARESTLKTDLWIKPNTSTNCLRIGASAPPMGNKCLMSGLT